VELFAVWLDLGDRGSGAKESPGCHLGDRGSCAKAALGSYLTKGKRLWLVLDGVDRAWAKCKDTLLVRDLFPVAALFWSGVGKRRGCCASPRTEEASHYIDLSENGCPLTFASEWRSNCNNAGKPH